MGRRRLDFDLREYDNLIHFRMKRSPEFSRIWSTLPRRPFYLNLVADCFNHTFYRYHYGNRFDRIKCPGPDRCRVSRPTLPNWKNTSAAREARDPLLQCQCRILLIEWRIGDQCPLCSISSFCYQRRLQSIGVILEFNKTVDKKKQIGLPPKFSERNLLFFLK